MKVISVNVGRPRQVEWKGTTATTAIFKDPVAGPVAVKETNLAGDQQADLMVHGGPEKAVYLYPSEHYEYWQAQLHPTQLTYGAFGENLTTEGISEESLHIGDELEIGSARFQVRQPRTPCWKLSLRFDRDDMTRRFYQSRRFGAYLSVLREGVLQAGDEIRLVSEDANGVSVADIVRLFTRDATELRAVGACVNPSGPSSWLARVFPGDAFPGLSPVQLFQ